MPNNLAQFSSDNCMRTNTKSKRSALLLLLFSVVMGVGGCTDYYGTYPAHGRPYYGGYGSYGPGYGRGWRSAVLHAWPRVLRRADLLRLEAGTLGTAWRTKSLDPRALRHKAIIKRNPPFPVDAAG